MDIYNYLERDHKKVAKLMRQVIKASNHRSREKIFLEIKQELELHADPEKDTFYKAIKEHGDPNNEINHGEEEHDEIKKALKKVSQTKNKEEWLIYFGELKHIVQHHVKKEENEIFEEAKKIFNPSLEQQLVLEMDELKQKKQESKSFINEFKSGVKKKKTSS